MLLPTHCPVCLRLGDAPCTSCAAELRSPPALPAPEGVDAAVALFAYEGVGRTLVTRLKYANHRDALPVLARALASLVAEGDVVADLVTWVPTTRPRRRERGFDQAELVARRVAAASGTACAATLRREGVSHQTGLGLAERAEARFTAIRAVPAAVLVVDDVRTTGSSLAAAARALRARGAVWVGAATLASTPRRGHTDAPAAPATITAVDAAPAPPGAAGGG